MRDLSRETPAATAAPMHNGRSIPADATQESLLSMNGHVDLSGSNGGGGPECESYTEASTLSRDELALKLKQHNADLTRRREEEERRQREESFLRGSLRGSEKLRALANRPAAKGIENNGYHDHGEDDPGRRRVLSATREEEPSLPPVLSYDEVVQLLSDLRSDLETSDSKNEWGFLENFVNGSQFQAAFELQESVSRAVILNGDQEPVCSTAEEARQSAVETLEKSGGRDWLAESHHMVRFAQLRELIGLLQGQHLKALLLAHDEVAAKPSDIDTAAVTDVSAVHLEPLPATVVLEVKDSLPPELVQQNNTSAAHVQENGPLADDVARERDGEFYEEVGEQGIKMVVLQKTDEPLGATVRNEGESVVVGRIVRGGIAEQSGLLHEGDELLSVNGMDLKGKNVNEVCDILSRMKGSLTFFIVPNQDFQPMKQTAMLSVRALFNYQPEDDLYNPCKEIGLSFSRGDILHIISQDDPNWWQAYREGDDINSGTLAGLIPSPNFQQEREQQRMRFTGETRRAAAESHRDKQPLCAKLRRGRRTKNRMHSTKRAYNPAELELYDGEEILTYERVTRYLPQPARKRPVVLVGPPNVGRHELRVKLIESELDRFAAAVPHTSRTARPGEQTGVDYHFVSTEDFEELLNQGAFVEYGKYERAWYGTSSQAISEVVQAGKVCILTLQPESLQALRATEFKPYVVMIAPPTNVDKLRTLRRRLSQAHISRGEPDEPATDNELLETIERGREMEELYGHLFDQVVINYDLDRAFQQLKGEINRLEVEPQWVPIQWVQGGSFASADSSPVRAARSPFRD